MEFDLNPQERKATNAEAMNPLQYSIKKNSTPRSILTKLQEQLAIVSKGLDFESLCYVK